MGIIYAIIAVPVIMVLVFGLHFTCYLIHGILTMPNEDIKIPRKKLDPNSSEYLAQYMPKV